MLRDPARKRALLRDVNERIRDLNLFPPPPRYEIHCECAGTDCADRLLVPGEMYERVLAGNGGFVVAQGHELRHERVLRADVTFSIVA